MIATNYLVLIQFAAKLTKQNLGAVAPKVRRAIENSLSDSQAVLSSDTCAAFVGVSTSDAATLFRDISSDLRPGDTLSVVPFTPDAATSHVELHQWQRRKHLGQSPTIKPARASST